jgi:PIN domain nuclease of toxin-antitoxin system
VKALLDTHTFLWWNMADEQLSQTAREIIADGSNEIYFSAASAWEIAIKTAKGRLVLPEDPAAYIAKRLQLHHFSPLPVEVSHAAQVYALPRHHDDPFDRLLIAQAQMEKMVLLSADPEIQKYEVETIW